MQPILLLLFFQLLSLAGFFLTPLLVSHHYPNYGDYFPSSSIMRPQIKYKIFTSQVALKNKLQRVAGHGLSWKNRGKIGGLRIMLCFESVAKNRFAGIRRGQGANVRQKESGFRFFFRIA
jgi:hypothetical protein